jgi:hypothetical protein
MLIPFFGPSVVEVKVQQSTAMHNKVQQCAAMCSKAQQCEALHPG